MSNYKLSEIYVEIQKDKIVYSGTMTNSEGEKIEADEKCLNKFECETSRLINKFLLESKISLNDKKINRITFGFEYPKNGHKESEKEVKD